MFGIDISPVLLNWIGWGSAIAGVFVLFFLAMGPMLFTIRTKNIATVVPLVIFWVGLSQPTSEMRLLISGIAAVLHIIIIADAVWPWKWSPTNNILPVIVLYGAVVLGVKLIPSVGSVLGVAIIATGAVFYLIFSSLEGKRDIAKSTGWTLAAFALFYVSFTAFSAP